MAYECLSEQRNIDDNGSTDGCDDKEYEDGYLFIQFQRKQPTQQKKETETMVPITLLAAKIIQGKERQCLILVVPIP